VRTEFPLYQRLLAVLWATRIFNPKTVFMIAATDGPLTAEEKRSLVKKR
jgi:hypothetical protein